ncbi:MAG: hypothetical protein A2W31_15600 [Planctomycetes bacterium RBG_16_64_10]|nr:MAG: hypothetical protein A2W31_15600 [Planctomycetes bacterium RBG_16_64_10]
MQSHVVSANEWLYPDSPIPASPARAIDLNTARGGRAGFQVLCRGLKAGEPLTCTFQGGLAPQVFQLVHVNVPENSGPPCSAIPPDQPTPDYVIRKAPYRVYEALRPFKNGDPARAETDAFYVSFMVPASAKPGLQEGRLLIQAGQETVEVSVTLNIHSAQVPEAGHLRVTNWFSTSHMARLHGVPPWSEAHWDMLRQYARLMRRGRQTDFIPVGPDVTKVGDESWTFDFARTERMIRMFLEEGFTHIELPHIAGHDRRKDAVARFVVSVDGKPTAGKSHEAYVYLAQYLTAWADMLRRNQWYGRATQHVVDEPHPRDFDDYRIMAGVVRKFLPGVPLIDALGEPELDGAVNIWVPLSARYEAHRDAFEAHRRRGDTIWFYTCCGPSGFYLNRFIDTELLRTRLLHWGNWRYRLDGYLHWGLNQIIPEQDPFENTCPPHGPYHEFHLPPGDSHIVYPGKDGPWSSVRFEAMGAGIEDYELLRIVAATDEQLADEICKSLVRTFTDYSAQVDAFDKAHVRLLEAASKSSGRSLR